MTDPFPENTAESDGRSHGDRSRGCEDGERREERLSHLKHAGHAGEFVMNIFRGVKLVKHFPIFLVLIISSKPN